MPNAQPVNNEAVIPLSLAPENHFQIKSSGSITVRVRQVTTANFGLIRHGYCGINTTDLEAQWALYDFFGFVGALYHAVPEIGHHQHD